MTQAQIYDVVILGGGPAGTAAALTLAQSGVRVVLLERSHYQEFRIGEMLAPEIRPLLTQLGQWDNFSQAGHLTCPGVLSCWGSEQVSENAFIFNPYGCGWHLERAEFDRTLAWAAAQAGVTVVNNTLVLEADYHQGTWQVLARQNRAKTIWQGKFLLDALGRKQLNKGILAQEKIYLDNLVGVAQLYDHNCPELTTDHRLMLEARESGWWYSAVLPRGKALAVLMSDQDLLPTTSTALRAYWQHHLRETSHTQERWPNCHPLGQLHIYDASTSCRSSCAGQSWLAVGDAAFTYDPLSAQGIIKAISNGIAAAEAILHSTYKDYQSLLLASFAQYQTLRNLYYAQERRWLNSHFWQRRLQG